MSFLKDLSTDESIAAEKDTLGSSGVLDSGAYAATIKLCFGITAGSGARGLTVHFETKEGRSFRNTFWLTSGTAKGCKNYYEKDGVKNYLPGYLQATALSLLTVGKELAELDFEEKTIQLYNNDAKAEVPTKVPMAVELLGKEIVVGLIKQIVDKTAKGDDNQYHPTGETREENDIDKLFRAEDLKTTAEIRAKTETAGFHDAWVAKWAGKTRDRSTKGGAGTAGAPKTAGAAATPKPSNSLFG